MIKLEEYTSGSYGDGFNYSYFIPTKIDDRWSYQSMDISKLLEKAAIRLGELNSLSQFIPNIDLFIQSYVAREAILSSKIEGTQTNMEEIAMPIDEIEPERREDWLEVNNYIRAMNEAIVELERLPISSRLIKKTHKILLDSVRGKNKQPGEYRRSQNWIGGNSLADAKFIPPAEHLVAEYMGDLEKFLNNTEANLPSLLKIAIAHYQFETIHPFLDGNGRIGRLLITLFLVSEKLLDRPLLYLSSYFEQNKSLYYDNLTYVREKNDMIHWLKYFLVGIEQTSADAVQRLKRVIAFKKECEDKVTQQLGRRSKYGHTLLNSLFSTPFVTVESVKKVCGLSYKSANDLVRDMTERISILKEVTGNSRNRVFLFKGYIDIFSSKL